MFVAIATPVIAWQTDAASFKHLLCIEEDTFLILANPDRNMVSSCRAWCNLPPEYRGSIVKHLRSSIKYLRSLAHPVAR